MRANKILSDKSIERIWDEFGARDFKVFTSVEEVATYADVDIETLTHLALVFQAMPDNSFLVMEMSDNIAMTDINGNKPEVTTGLLEVYRHSINRSFVRCSDARDADFDCGIVSFSRYAHGMQCLAPWGNVKPSLLPEIKLRNAGTSAITNAKTKVLHLNLVVNFAGKDNAVLFTKSQLETWLGVDAVTVNHVHVSVMNGDGASAGKYGFQTVEWWGGTYNSWYLYLDKACTGNIRVNTMITYFIPE